MPDYSKGKIYKILNNIDDEIYVGSTCETLGKRMAKHRGDIKRTPQKKLFKHMLELGIDNFYIELIENFSCNDVYELRAREGHFIREIGTLNMVIAGRTKKEYKVEHKEEIHEYNKKYYEDNKEYFKEYDKQYKEEHQEELKEYRKQQRQDNKEYFKEYDKRQYAKHKERYKHYFETKKDKLLEKNVCSLCGAQVCRTNMLRHQKTTKCINNNKNLF